ncbi:MAG: DoxX family protein [Actinomycetota bacterium]
MRTRTEPGELAEPSFSRMLFASTPFGWLWLVVRVYLGYEWVRSGWEKLTDPAWMSTGVGLKGFAAFAASQANGPHAAVNYGWYAAFLRWIADTSYPWMAKLISIGEFTVGVLLILGLFTGIAAFLAGLLSFSFGLAGVAGVNPVFFLLEVLLILAWRNAGWIGLDRWVLPALGTPWQPGTVFARRRTARDRARVTG